MKQPELEDEELCKEFILGFFRFVALKSIGGALNKETNWIPASGVLSNIFRGPQIESEIPATNVCLMLRSSGTLIPPSDKTRDDREHTN